jgi:hypothetical protein
MSGEPREEEENAAELKIGEGAPPSPFPSPRPNQRSLIRS